MSHDFGYSLLLNNLLVNYRVYSSVQFREITKLNLINCWSFLKIELINAFIYNIVFTISIQEDIYFKKEQNYYENDSLMQCW